MRTMSSYLAHVWKVGQICNRVSFIFQLKSQDISDLRAVEREDSSLLTPAAKKLKIDTKDKKEKKQKVDEDEIQKMQ